MARAKDIMKTDVINVEPETPALIAANIIECEHNRHVASLPVLYSDGTVAGMISESDLMKMFTLRKSRCMEDITTCDIMTKGVVTADENDDIGEVGCHLLRAHFRQMPVVSNGKYVGMISRGELLKHVVEIGC